MAAITVRLHVRDKRIAAALGRRLSHSGFVVDNDGSAGSSAVIVIASEVTPRECRAIIGAGSSVVVLAALPTEADRERYLTAGATAYLPMVVDSAALVRSLQSGSGAQQVPLTAARPVSALYPDAMP